VSVEGNLAAVNLMASDTQNCVPRDWAGNRLTLAAIWGMPAAAMLLALLLEPVARAVVWTVMLAWMGWACLQNARRCGRTHCRYTGPFFLAMAVLVVAYATGIVPLGDRPWLILGMLTVAGNVLIWWGSERLLGTYSRRRD